VIAVDRIPVTAVGKVFKPELRLDAARRHLAAELAALGGRARVTAEPDGAGVLRVYAPARETDRVRALLDQYTLAHEVVIDTERS
jgi:fatty-acyl-CoA synthase